MEHWPSDMELIKRAMDAREQAYAPYSAFLVGAAVLFDSGRVYTGCNVENASYGASNCAERTAIFAAVAAGELASGAAIRKVVVVGGKKGENLDFCPPCGICLQVISEFARSNTICEVVLAKMEWMQGRYREIERKSEPFTAFLPKGFSLNR